MGRWTTFEKWVVGLAIAFVLLAILGGNTADQWNGVIQALGSVALLAWLFTIPLALLFIGIRGWNYLRTRKQPR